MEEDRRKIKKTTEGGHKTRQNRAREAGDMSDSKWRRITRKDSKYQASVAEWSKALVSGTGLFGVVGSNPTTCILIRERERQYM